MNKLLIAVLLLLVPNLFWAQSSVPDTVVLTEVVLYINSGENPALNQYQTTRQNGIEDVLERLPGLSLIRRGNYAPDVMIHGMRNEQVGITIDGMQIFGACTDRMDPVTSYVETNNLDQVNQGEGSSSAGCHTANIGGGLNLGLKTPAFTPGIKGTLGSGYVSNGNGFNNLLNLNASNKKFAANVNAIYRKQNNYTDGNGKEVLYTQYEKINVATNLSWRMSDKQLLRFNFILDDAFNVGYAALPMDVAYAKAKIMGLTYTWFPNGFAKKVDAKIYYNTISHAMDDSQRPDVAIRMDMPGYSNTWGAFVEATSTQRGKHEWFAKAEAFSNFRHAEMTMYPPNTEEPPMFMLTWPDVRKTSTLLFGQHTFTLNKKWQSTLKMRLQLDFNDITTEAGKSYMEPFGYQGASSYILPFAQLNVLYKISESAVLNLATGYSSRGPSTSEQYAFYLFNAYDGYDYIGMPSIKKEQSVSAEMAYKWHNKTWQFAWTAYGYYITDYILGITDATLDAMTIGAHGVRVYNNIAHAQILGSDISAQANLNKWIQILGKVGYTQGKLSDGSNLPLMPPLHGNLSAKTTYKTWEFMAELEWATAQNKVNLNYGDAKTPGYGVGNLRVLKSFDFTKTALNVEAGVNNIFDAAYRNHLDWGGILRPGRSLYFQITFKF